MKLREASYGGFPDAGRIAHPERASSNSVLRRNEETLNGLADSFGMTNITNTAKKPPPQTPRGKYGNMNIMGVDVPIGDTSVTVSGSTPYSAFSVKAENKMPGRQVATNNLSSMTQVQASHKG